MQAAQLKGQSVIHVAFQALQLIVTDFVAPADDVRLALHPNSGKIRLTAP